MAVVLIAAALLFRCSLATFNTFPNNGGDPNGFPSNGGDPNGGDPNGFDLTRILNCAADAEGGRMNVGLSPLSRDGTVLNDNEYWLPEESE